MEESKALTVQETMDIATHFAKSGLFTDAAQLEKAFVKIMAGQELGIPPFAAMTGIHVIQGKATLGAGLIASRVRGSGKYDYEIIRHDEEECHLKFWRMFPQDEVLGESRFTVQDAKAAGLLSNPTWQKYPKNMLFARAISNGARWYCPDVFSGPVYTPEELGADVDVIDVTPTVIEPGQSEQEITEPKAQPGQPETESDVQSFIRISNQRNHFWATTNKMGLSSDQVHLILGVKSMYDYHDTEDKALATLRDYQDSQADQPEEGAFGAHAGDLPDHLTNGS